MKKNIVFVLLIIVLGALIAVGPLTLFRICSAAEMVDDLDTSCCGPAGYPRCQWTAQAEIGIGGLIVGLGLCMLVFAAAKTRMTLAIGTLLAGLAAIAVPNFLIGGCPSSFDMRCHQITFPCITIVGVFVIITSAIMIIRNRKA